MIKIKKIPPQKAKLFSPKGKFIAELNEFEFNDVRIQIAEQGLEGYHILHNNTRYEINRYGTIPNWGEGLYDMIENQLSTLFKIQLNSIEKHNKPKVK